VRKGVYKGWFEGTMLHKVTL